MLRHFIWISLVVLVIKCNRFTPEIPERCLNHTLCEDVPNYPHQYVQHVIRKLMEQGFQWPTQVLAYANKTKKLDQEDEFEFIDVCPSIKKVIVPQAAKDSRGKWRFILNQKENPMQRIQMEICKFENMPCGTGIADDLLTLKECAGYTSRCEQKLLNFMLVSFDKDGTITETFTNVSICCSCIVYHNYT